MTVEPFNSLCYCFLLCVDPGGGKTRPQKSAQSSKSSIKEQAGTTETGHAVAAGAAHAGAAAGIGTIPHHNGQDPVLPRMLGRDIPLQQQIQKW